MAFISRNGFKHKKGDNWSPSAKQRFEQDCYENNDYIKYTNFSEMITNIDIIRTYIIHAKSLCPQDSNKEHALLDSILKKVYLISNQAETLRDSADYKLELYKLEMLHSQIIDTKLYH